MFKKTALLVQQGFPSASGSIWWPNLQKMQKAPSGGHICDKYKWCHLVGKFATNASGAMLSPNCVQVTESIPGSVVPLAMFSFDNLSWSWLEHGYVKKVLFFGGGTKIRISARTSVFLYGTQIFVKGAYVTLVVGSV